MPLANVGPPLPNLMAALSGNFFKLREFAGLKLVGIDLPHSFARAYPGSCPWGTF